MLQIDGICAGYGDLKVLYDVSMRVETGECVALVGSNGVGKTTLLNVIGGHVPATSGKIQWNDVALLEKSDPWTERNWALRTYRRVEGSWVPCLSMTICCLVDIARGANLAAWRTWRKRLKFFPN